MSVDPKPRPLNHLWNTAQAVGVIVTLTGFTPDRWMTAFLEAVKLPDWLFAGIDPRFIAVGIGVAIIAADAFLRHRKRPQQSLATSPVASLVTASSPAEAPVAAMPLRAEAMPRCAVVGGHGRQDRGVVSVGDPRGCEGYDA